MSKPTIITHFPGQKVEQYLRLMGVLPGEFDDAEVVASARRIVTLIDKGYPDERGKPHRAKSSTLYRVLSAFLAIAEIIPPTGDVASEDEVVREIHEAGTAAVRDVTLREALRSVRVYVQDCIENGHDRTMLGNMYGARDEIDKALSHPSLPDGGKP